jgi:hypothetical protein
MFLIDYHNCSLDDIVSTINMIDFENKELKEAVSMLKEIFLFALNNIKPCQATKISDKTFLKAKKLNIKS